MSEKALEGHASTAEVHSHVPRCASRALGRLGLFDTSACNCDAQKPLLPARQDRAEPTPHSKLVEDTRGLLDAYARFMPSEKMALGSRLALAVGLLDQWMKSEVAAPPTRTKKRSEYETPSIDNTRTEAAVLRGLST